MYLQSLQLWDFRNFERLQVQLTPRLNFFVGENGQGKTNLVEAVHLLSRGVSFRPADPANFLRKNVDNSGDLRGLSSGFAGGPIDGVTAGSAAAFRALQNPKAKIAGTFEHHGLDFLVEMVLERGKKSATINGKRVNSAGLLKSFPTVLFSPESLSAIKEGPDQRRQLIDEILISCDPKQGQLLREQSRALRSRNRLLKNLSEGLGNRLDNEEALESLNKIYFLLSTHLTHARITSLKAIEPAFKDAMRFISDDTVGDISVDYVISDQSAMDWTDEKIFEALRKRHQELIVQEKSYGGSLVGPHKHDIKFLLSGNDSRFYSSQGQQRALILALKIAQIVYHHSVHQTYPMLLLDDVLSELDAKKRVNLMKFLEGVSAQILITSTDLAWSDQFGFDRNTIFQVTSGRVEQRGS